MDEELRIEPLSVPDSAMDYRRVLDECIAALCARFGLPAEMFPPDPCSFAYVAAKLAEPRS